MGRDRPQGAVAALTKHLLLAQTVQRRSSLLVINFRQSSSVATCGEELAHDGNQIEDLDTIIVEMAAIA